jgi:inorganic pyrophosphatase
MTNLARLPVFSTDGAVHVVVEASRGMRVKCKYDPELKTFVFGKPLPHGLAYPFDWGFIPATEGADGDPLDALVLHDAACPVGCLIQCRPVAVLRVLEQHKHERRRNDRFLLSPADDPAMEEQEILVPRLKRELESFFAAIATASGKRVEMLGWHGRKAALAAIEKAIRE